jgi:hypothetical protein
MIECDPNILLVRGIRSFEGEESLVVYNLQGHSVMQYTNGI